ncbi:rhodanese-like domain-containing protein [Dokdonella sp.]|uniref:rhodanese-like domain-containing protein n=1 Tax=Dokdonella sp. TaxID=2291710 RepID=UPI00352938D1
MKLHWIAWLLLALALPSIASEPRPLSNPAIDMDGYLALASEAAAHRQSRRLDEADFRRMSEAPGTIVLDARSRDKFELLHVDGAINLSFPDITVASLETLLPDKDVRILIYCNNNFSNNEDAFPRKLKTASLNLSTYIALYTYGYRNIYELMPLIDTDETQLTLVSSE